MPVAKMLKLFNVVINVLHDFDSPNKIIFGSVSIIVKFLNLSKAVLFIREIDIVYYFMKHHAFV